MPDYFLQMLQHLRHYEEVILYGNLLHVSEENETVVATYLKSEYENETLEYPFAVPDFDPDAAVWAAKTLYIATQLLLYREHKNEDVERLLQPYYKEVTAAALLSADLTLRFLPAVANKLQQIDPEDRLIKLLTTHLITWHYSGIAFPLPVAQLDLDVLGNNKCLQQLYVNRVIEVRNLVLARHPALETSVRASLGFFKNIFWNDLKPDPIITK
jgi:hypothetical protein